MLHSENLLKKYRLTKKVSFYSITYGAICLMLVLISTGQSHAGSLVTAKYTIRDNTVILKIKTAATGPGNIIVSQHLPRGNKIVDAEPAFSAYHPKRARAKWLLKDLKPGTYKIVIKMKKPADKKKISAAISFMNPETGRLSTIRVKP